MKRVFIIHQWMADAQGDWYPWLAQQLKEKGYEVFLPQMPNQDNPIIEERVSFLDNLVGTPDMDTYFIGHSIGCQVIMRYFETLPENIKVGGAVFIAGWFNLAGLESEGEEIMAIAKPWIETPIDFLRVKKVCSKIEVLLSSTEPYGYLEENKTIFEKNLGAHVAVLPNRGHFMKSDGVVEVPEVLDILDRM